MVLWLNSCRFNISNHVIVNNRWWLWLKTLLWKISPRIFSFKFSKEFSEQIFCISAMWYGIDKNLKGNNCGGIVFQLNLLAYGLQFGWKKCSFIDGFHWVLQKCPNQHFLGNLLVIACKCVVFCSESSEI